MFFFPWLLIGEHVEARHIDTCLSQSLLEPLYWGKGHALYRSDSQRVSCAEASQRWKQLKMLLFLSKPSPLPSSEERYLGRLLLVTRRNNKLRDPGNRYDHDSHGPHYSRLPPECPSVRKRACVLPFPPVIPLGRVVLFCYLGNSLWWPIKRIDPCRRVSQNLFYRWQRSEEFSCY